MDATIDMDDVCIIAANTASSNDEGTSCFGRSAALGSPIRASAAFAAFFGRPDTFALGICNGCQMMAQLKEIIPGAAHWPVFTRNVSEQFEARYVTLEILRSPSVLLDSMAGARIPVPVAHGEGFANFSATGSIEQAVDNKLVAARYVDNYGVATERYPFNPNGSPEGITGLTTTDGRVTIMMPHPERVFRTVQMSYWPANGKRRFTEEGPWLRMFQNAYEFTHNACTELRASPGGLATAGAVVFLLLFGDLVLPVPSSVVMLLAGTFFGVVGGTVLTFTASFAGNALGYGLCRRFGRRAFDRLVGSDDLPRIAAFMQRSAPWAILLSRSVPMLTEVVSCLAGLTAYPARRFLLLNAAGTLPVCLVYAWAGSLPGEPGLHWPLLVAFILPAAGYAVFSASHRH